jgi:uncharacterized repeat protein (TIGR01451 family)
MLNEAQVSSAAFDPDPSNNQASETTSVIESADLGVSTIDDPEPAMPGEPLTYIVTVNNYGPFDATGVVFTDTLPSEVTLQLADPSQGECIATICTLGTILAGNSAQVTLITLVDIGVSG